MHDFRHDWRRRRCRRRRRYNRRRHRFRLSDRSRLFRFGIMILGVGMHVLMDGLFRVRHGHIPYERAEGTVMEPFPAQTVASRKHTGHILWIVHVHVRARWLRPCCFIIG